MDTEQDQDRQPGQDRDTIQALGSPGARVPLARPWVPAATAAPSTCATAGRRRQPVGSDGRQLCRYLLRRRLRGGRGVSGARS